MGLRLSVVDHCRDIIETHMLGSDTLKPITNGSFSGLGDECRVGNVQYAEWWNTARVFATAGSAATPFR